MNETTILIKSTQAGIVVTHEKPKFRYEFNDNKPVEIPISHAKIILTNKTFKEIKKGEN